MFERGAAKATGGEGWADVWKKGFFGWEYKGRNKDLDTAYLQLLRYQGALENPPLLVTCDTDRIIIHTHHPNTPTQVIELTLEGLADPAQLAALRSVFHDPNALRPDKTIQAITEEAASQVTAIAQALRQRDLSPERVARFLDRVVFCLFAEDVRLLPNKVFTRLVENTQGKPDRFRALAAELFAQMATGGDFGADRIDYFNGNLFETVEALELTVDELRQLLTVTYLDWSNIDASIFGTLFERALDPDKRSQLGAHYTSREDIESIVEPVVLAPLRAKWNAVREEYDLLSSGIRTLKDRKWRAAESLMRGFLGELGSVTILDPACGSGNFLFVTLQKLKDLEKEVIIHASAYFSFFPQVGPWQLRGIEVNAYAHDLAQMTVWIGHLQWHDRHGMPLEERPILRPMTNFELKDAVLRVEDEHEFEPSWPDAEFIVGNPPFLGGKKLRDNLGDAYVEHLYKLWDDRVPSESDYCCYWFEKARAQIEAGKARRAGLLATQSIRGGANRVVLERIKRSGDIFFAVSSREWVLDGANVHVSMVGFDNGDQIIRTLDGELATTINADLTKTVDATQARRLPSARGRSFMGDTKVGPFEIPVDEAVALLNLPNPNGQPNSDVLRPWVNGLDITRRPRDLWIVDYAPGTTRQDAALYEAPFEYIDRHVRPMRAGARSGDATGVPWWIHQRPRPEMRRALEPLTRFLARLTLAKHPVFAWLYQPTLPDHQLIVFALDDAASFGILQSKVHAAWALRKGTKLETRPRYTPTTTFETFAFPDLSPEQIMEIGAIATELDRLRVQWLFPPEWTQDVELTFPGSTRGPWRSLVEAPDAVGIGTVKYRRKVPADETASKALKKRSMTRLYNTSPAWLTDLHVQLDRLVLAAYGLPGDAGDDAILTHLLQLNLTRSSPLGV